MWILIMFDMPTETKREIKIHKAFLKNLVADDFIEVLPTVYIRNCASEKSAETRWNHIKDLLPYEGILNVQTVKFISVTDEEFSNIQTHRRGGIPAGGFGIGY